MSSDQLFELGEGDRRPEAEPQSKVSTDRRRTQRRMARLQRGLHPLFLDTPHRLHHQAAPWDDRAAEGRRCGGCLFLANNGRYLKCGYGDGVRITYGPASDLRKWWPACTEHEATS